MRLCCYVAEANPDEPDVDPESLFCSEVAEWSIYGTRPDDQTDSCTEHVGNLLGDADYYSVYPIIEDQA